MKRSALFLFLLCFLQIALEAQQPDVDSLNILLKNDKDDSNKVIHLTGLAAIYLDSDPPKVLDYANRALKLSQSIKWERGIALSWHTIGYYHYTQANYTLTLDYWFKSLKIYEKIGNKVYIASRLGNIGMVYDDIGDFPKALDFYFRSLKMKEEIGDKDDIAITLGNIGVTYHGLGEPIKALEYDFKALKIHEEINSQKGMARHLNNIAIVYTSQASQTDLLDKKDSLLDMALDNYFQALKIDEEGGNKWGMIKRLGNIGMVYFYRKQYDKTLEYQARAIMIAREIGDNRSLAQNLQNMGSTYMDLKNASKAEKYLLEALEIDTMIGLLPHAQHTYEELTKLFRNLGNEKRALYYYERSIQLKDSIFNMEKEKDITRTEMLYQFAKQQAADSTRVAEEKKVMDAEFKKEQTQRYALSFGLAIILIFSVILYNRYRITTKQKAVIASKNAMLDEQNKEIIDNISYAKNIQNALLHPEENIKSAFTDAFVLLLPKDIVSGDFYWFAQVNGYKVLAVADCTGHGVPGGFISMLGYEMLQDIFMKEDIKTSAQALTLLDKKLTDTLNKKTQLKDGIDMALCLFGNDEGTFQYSGAMRPLLQVSGNILTHHTPDKHGLGGNTGDEIKKFLTEEITATSGDVFYMYSDGFADQFGGAEGKKFRQGALSELLVSINMKPMHEQKKILHETFENWKGGHEQIDDVLIVGFRI